MPSLWEALSELVLAVGRGDRSWWPLVGALLFLVALSVAAWVILGT